MAAAAASAAAAHGARSSLRSSCRLPSARGLTRGSITEALWPLQGRPQQEYEPVSTEYEALSQSATPPEPATTRSSQRRTLRGSQINELSCPQGHRLLPDTSSGETCQRCAEFIDEGGMSWHCAACQWKVCEPCYEGFKPEEADVEADAHLQLRRRLSSFLGNAYFQAFMALLIATNAVVIGLETDYPDMADWAVLELLFLLVFTCELTMRLVSQGWAHYFDPDAKDFAWQLMDFMVVSCGLIDVLGHVCGLSSSGAGVATIFRMARLLRILRVFKVVRFLRQLYQLAMGMTFAISAIFWVAILLFFLLYVCAVILVKLVHHVPESEKDHEFLWSKFHCIPKAMLTLFELMVNPYLDPFHEVIGHDWLLTVFLIGFVIFGSFGMIGLLTGVIQENMFKQNDMRKEEEKEQHSTRRRKLMRACADLFDEIELLDDGDAPVDCCAELLPRIARMFNAEGLTFPHEECLAQVALAMDGDASGSVSKEEFSKFLSQMIEEMQPVFFMELRYDVISFVKERSEELLAKLEELERQIAPRERPSPPTKSYSSQGFGGGSKSQFGYPDDELHQAGSLSHRALESQMSALTDALQASIRASMKELHLSLREALRQHLCDGLQDGMRSVLSEMRAAAETQETGPVWPGAREGSGRGADGACGSESLAKAALVGPVVPPLVPPDGSSSLGADFHPIDATLSTSGLLSDRSLLKRPPAQDPSGVPPVARPPAQAPRSACLRDLYK